MQRKPGVKYFVHLRLWCYLGVIRKVCTLKYENFDPPLSCTLSYVSRRPTPASYALNKFPPSLSPPPPPHTHTHTHTYIGNLSSPDFIYLYGLRINDSRCQNTSSLLQITIILTFYQKIKREDLFYYETWRHSKR